jgi:hypothetical protein
MILTFKPCNGQNDVLVPPTEFWRNGLINAAEKRFPEIYPTNFFAYGKIVHI